MAENCAQNNLPCCGCGACVAACPQGALTLRLNEDGFYTPVTDLQKCNYCGLCLNVCQKFSNNYYDVSKQFTALPLYAAWSNDEQSRLKSSSGAVAYELALYGLENGYKIAGAVYDGASGKVNTVIADTKEKLEGLRGSKYVQSFTADAFGAIAQSKDKFIFFGTPCQVMGLKLLARAGKFEDRILTVDFFCHGVGSIKMLDACLNAVAPAGTDGRKVYFRHKKEGCGPYTMLIQCGKEEITLQENKNPFYALYFSDLFLGEACYNCRAKKSFDFADIRLGDFWGDSLTEEGKGVCAVCTATQKGTRFIEDLTKLNKITISPRAHDICLKEQACFKDKPYNPAVRNVLFSTLKAGATPDKLIGEYIKTLGFKKYLIFKLKRILPFALVAAARKIYRGLK